MIGEGRSHCPLAVYKIAISLFFLANRILGLGTLCVFQGRWAQIHGMNNDWPKPVVLSGEIDFVPQGTFNNVWRYFWLPQLGENCSWHLTGEARDATQQLTTVQHCHCRVIPPWKPKVRNTAAKSSLEWSRSLCRGLVEACVCDANLPNKMQREVYWDIPEKGFSCQAPSVHGIL